MPVCAIACWRCGWRRREKSPETCSAFFHDSVLISIGREFDRRGAAPIKNQQYHKQVDVSIGVAPCRFTMTLFAAHPCAVKATPRGEATFERRIARSENGEEVFSFGTKLATHNTEKFQISKRKMLFIDVSWFLKYEKSGLPFSCICHPKTALKARRLFLNFSICIWKHLKTCRWPLVYFCL